MEENRNELIHSVFSELYENHNWPNINLDLFFETQQKEKNVNIVNQIQTIHTNKISEYDIVGAEWFTNSQFKYSP
jgi:hypothetical protein